MGPYVWDDAQGTVSVLQAVQVRHYLSLSGHQPSNAPFTAFCCGLVEHGGRRRAADVG